jgi:dTDP-4-amino-4,6-dideoxygalactose transaminase
MYPRHRIDIGLGDLAFAARACARRADRRRLAEAVERLVSPPDGALACLSVRSGFDLLLDALDFPSGSDILVSAITHPDMVGIVELHGLRPVPVDLDLDTLAPRPELVESAIGPSTRALLVSPLFGTTVDLEPYAELARGTGLLLIEDCAQSLHEPGLRGDPHADATLFSFGPIKTATALGGAVVRVRDPELRERMREALAGRPVQPRRQFLARVLKFAALSALARPRAFRAFVRLCERQGRDLDEMLSSFVRGFKVPYDDAAFRKRIRRRPCGPLLRLLHRRLATFDVGRLARRAALGEHIVEELPAPFFHPGWRAPIRSHWVLPVVSADPTALIAALRREGLDAAPPHATSAIVVVPAPPESPETEAVSAQWLMEHVVFLPAYPELPERAVRRLLDAVREVGATAAPVEPPRARALVR